MKIKGRGDEFIFCYIFFLKYYSYKVRIFKNLSIMFCNLDVNKFKGFFI